MKDEFTVPVALIVFNRPSHTAKVLDAIRAVRPKELMVVADGPRPDRPEDGDKCEAVRALFDNVGWNCSISRNFAPTNLGCRGCVSAGLDWVFEQAEQAIILEDDCLPHHSFFGFCSDLLDRYRNDKRIMGITGDNFQNGVRRGEASYYFSRYFHIWGWATWRRAWRHFDVDVQSWQVLRRSNWLSKLLNRRVSERVWARNFESVYERQLDTWDYQWQYAVWMHGGLVATPNINLVSNIGTGGDATHTIGDGPLFRLPTFQMESPLSHPAEVTRDVEADEYIERTIFAPPLSVRLNNKARRLLRRRW